MWKDGKGTELERSDTMGTVAEAAPYVAGVRGHGSSCPFTSAH